MYIQSIFVLYIECFVYNILPHSHWPRLSFWHWILSLNPKRPSLFENVERHSECRWHRWIPTVQSELKQQLPHKLQFSMFSSLLLHFHDLVGWGRLSFPRCMAQLGLGDVLQGMWVSRLVVEPKISSLRNVSSLGKHISFPANHFNI